VSTVSQYNGLGKEYVGGSIVLNSSHPFPVSKREKKKVEDILYLNKILNNWIRKMILIG